MAITRSIRSSLLVAASVASVLVVTGLFIILSQVYERTLREDARQVSGILARHTFTSMYQIMSRGWARHDVEQFIQGVKKGLEDEPMDVTIYRAPRVEELYGQIQQPTPDKAVQEAFQSGAPSSHPSPDGIRHLYPLKAEQRCLRCHTNASVDDVLGVIEVRQDLTEVLSRARSRFIVGALFVAPLPLLLALLVANMIGRRISLAVDDVRTNVEKINRVDDLTTFSLEKVDPGFQELNALLSALDKVWKRLHGMAVDKDLLEFEIKLLEGFILTSEVVRDWREHVRRLVIEINRFLPAYALMSVFRVKDEVVELEFFWCAPPSPQSTQLFERAARDLLADHPVLGGVNVQEIKHHVADKSSSQLHLKPDEVHLQSKSLLVDTPKIGGIVGIGLQISEQSPVRHLVVEGILTTLLNVVGSVKAIARYTRELEYYATRDPLTNLYNQRVFWELFGYEIGRAERHNHVFALLVIDLDNFKAINDSYGHIVGDRYLQGLANEIHGCLRNCDIFARFGGDEFVALLPETDQEESRQAAERLLKSVEAFHIEADDGSLVRATISVGLVFYPTHGKSPEDLFLLADHMMYRAKGEGKNRLVLPTDEEALYAAQELAQMAALVRQAVEDRRVDPWYQPIVDIPSGKIYGHEVLSRIPLDDGEPLGAARFIEIAEQQGLIARLDFIVMEKAFKRVAETGYKGLLFINLSPKALVLELFFDQVKRLIADSGIDPGQIVFELTERETVKNIVQLEGFVKRLYLEGFSFAIDDFGSGFSSFQYVKRFPVDFIKIEGEFVANMLSDTRDKAVVTSIAGLAEEIGIQTIAEYVESEEVLEYLRKAGVNFAQGYHLAPPSQDLLSDDWKPMTRQD